MHLSDRKSANLRYFELRCFRLAAIIALATSFVTGCSNPTAVVSLSWDLSKSTNVSCLSNGKWLGPNNFVYHIEGSREFHLSIISKGDRTFDFDSVSHIYVQQETSQISSIKIASYGYTLQGAVDRVLEMDKHWKGKGVGDLEKWLADIKKGSLRKHMSTIQFPENADVPGIWTCIHYNFGGKKTEWFTMTTFFWPTPIRQKIDAENRRSDTMLNENRGNETE